MAAARRREERTSARPGTGAAIARSVGEGAVGGAPALVDATRAPTRRHGGPGPSQPATRADVGRPAMVTAGVLVLLLTRAPPPRRAARAAARFPADHRAEHRCPTADRVASEDRASPRGSR